MTARATRALGLLLAAALLGACAHLPVGGDGLSFEERRARLEAFAHWEMRGRLAVDTPDAGGFQGSFEWRQAADHLSLAVRGPLGAGALRVAGTPSALEVTSRGETWALRDPETELSEMLGWWLPVASLRDWLLGLPDRDHRVRVEPGPEGVVESLEQRLWRLDYVTYQLREGLLIPRRIDMSHGALRVRLTVDSWRPATEGSAS